MPYLLASCHPLRIGRVALCMYVTGVILLCTGIAISAVTYKSCGTVQQKDCSPIFKILGPTIAAFGLGSLVLARSRGGVQDHHSRPQGDVAEDEESLPTNSNGPYIITVGDEIFTFPDAPPSYFEIPMEAAHGGSTMGDEEDLPPSYESLFSRRYIGRLFRFQQTSPPERNSDQPPPYEEIYP
ncbi:transmembrane protein 171-like [Pseudophryne corroboree]|uniref:transmembrane protein 171-like n=1 Tax=Pseudophryne corroboree TaxID=495146 RepID=UPI003081737D